ncbi:MAG: guanylate kinase [Saprospiraceae bacterium]|nr:guanylate kinase [Saprospiraceae bacterium]HMW39883.1 guanylate kinase [Saprospiraceae bacterium]HMX88285.1 guanylate kinase [Saprospiraceae bacterium]HMZ40431.1 guanylate kinase [Saprospiraceae bacterium]HNB30238.1 guanylate kinase [Saprospiraceae bacterium]
MTKVSGKIIIFTAPSGSGKTTLAKHALSLFPQLSFSVSATTRSPREGEMDGRDYYFVSQEQFKSLIADHKLFEYQEVYTHQYYGTLKSELERIWSQDKVALFDIDVKGAFGIEQLKQKNVLTIYIKTSSLDVLRQRLVARHSDSEESIEQRLRRAGEELEYAKYFDYVITNDRLDLAKKMVEVLIEDFLQQPL